MTVCPLQKSIFDLYLKYRWCDCINWLRW